MNQLNLTDYLEITRAVIYSIGGPAVIIIGLSTFLGNHFSKREIENLKSKHNKELEQTKAQLDRAKSQFFRYSEKQFDLYNNLWLVLVRTRDIADSLWEDASPIKLPGFSEQIRLTRQAVTDNMLLIEESHYKDLDTLLKEFEEFHFGRQKLIDIRTTGTIQPIVQATEQEVKLAISKNKKVKNKYTDLIFKIGNSFREQIKG